MVDNLFLSLIWLVTMMIWFELSKVVRLLQTIAGG
jgi:hypothetical protein